MWPLERGLGLDYVTSYGERLGALEVGSVARELESCMGHEVVTLVGPQAEITGQLEAMEIDHSILDWRAERDRLMQAEAPDRWRKAEGERGE